MTPSPLQAPGLAALDGIRHGFFTRRGGVSRALYADLNCGFGSGDDPGAVGENRRRVARTIGAEVALDTVHQVHGTKVARAVGPWPGGGSPRADAMVSTTPGVALGVLAADCAPILLADPAAGVVGAVHAGWKGALAGVTDATLRAMVALLARPERIRAAVGPCIAQASYEVGPELRAQFLDQSPDNRRFFHAGKRDGHHHFDLPGYLEHRLRRAGVGAVERLDRDSYAEPEDFYSYRRATHRGEADYGRAISVIMLAGAGQGA